MNKNQNDLQEELEANKNQGKTQNKNLKLNNYCLGIWKKIINPYEKIHKDLFIYYKLLAAWIDSYIGNNNHISIL